MEALARFWGWERAVREAIPRVVDTRGICTLFQPIFDLAEPTPLVRAYQAYARFPAVPEAPTGLWYNVASRLGLKVDLEVAAARRVIDGIDRLPSGALVFISISYEAVAEMVGYLSPAIGHLLVLDLPGCTVPDDPLIRDRLDRLGVRTAVKQQGGLTYSKDYGRGRPDFLRTDLTGGVEVADLSRLTAARAWCQARGVTLVASGVDRVSDLKAVGEFGVEWVQGYALGPPTSL